MTPTNYCIRLEASARRRINVKFIYAECTHKCQRDPNQHSVYTVSQKYVPLGIVHIFAKY